MSELDWPMRAATASIVTGLALAACARVQGSSTSVEALTSQLQSRLGPEAELQFFVRRNLSEGEALCGYATASNAQPIAFVVRRGRLTLPADTDAQTFDGLQDAICGPSWTKPRIVDGVP